MPIPPDGPDGFPIYKRVAWNDGFRYTSPVGSFQPNGFGLYDITGNIWEWCRDFLGNYATSTTTTNPIGPASAESSAVRGGSFADGAINQRIARRAVLLRVTGDQNLGFRVLRDLDDSP